MPTKLARSVVKCFQLRELLRNRCDPNYVLRLRSQVCETRQSNIGVLGTPNGAGLKSDLRKQEALVGTNVLHERVKCQNLFFRNIGAPVLALDSPQASKSILAEGTQGIDLVFATRA